MATGSITQVPQPTTDFVPEVFGRLTTLDSGYMVQYGKHRRRYHRVRCECGTVKQVLRSDMKSGHTKSCGCLNKEKTAQANTTHGHCKGGRWSPEYAAYQSMLERCYRPKAAGYDNYGGRGIKVFPDWLGPGGFERWLAHIGPIPVPGLTLERKYVNKDYEPGNVCWATDEEQANNKRNNRSIEHRGRTQTVAQWARETGIKATVIYDRLYAGWTAEKALSTPIKHQAAQ